VGLPVLLVALTYLTSCRKSFERVEAGESFADDKKTGYSDFSLNLITAYIADASRKWPAKSLCSCSVPTEPAHTMKDDYPPPSSTLKHRLVRKKGYANLRQQFLARSR
jgi:hypothetical protein